LYYNVIVAIGSVKAMLLVLIVVESVILALRVAVLLTSSVVIVLGLVISTMVILILVSLVVLLRESFRVLSITSTSNHDSYNHEGSATNTGSTRISDINDGHMQIRPYSRSQVTRLPKIPKQKTKIRKSH